MNAVKRIAVACVGMLVAGAGVAALSPQALALSPGTQTIAEGVVVDRTGVSAADAAVVAYAWPSNDVLATMKPGARFDLVPVSQGVSDARGTYRLQGEISRLAPFRDSQGNVNLEIVTRAADGSTASTTAGVSSETPRRIGRLKSAQVGQLRLGTATAHTEGTAQAVPMGAPVPCGGSFQKDLGLHTVWIGGHYSTTTGVVHDLVYSRGATSSLGVGTSLTGKFGSFKAGGTTSVSATGTVGFPATAGRQHDYTYFDYGSYLVGCAGTMKHVVRARFWAGGAHYWTPPTAPRAPYCVPQDRHTTYIQDHTSAYTFSSGADVSSVIGVDLSSQTGYSSSTRVTFDFKGRAGLMCGTAGPPGKGGVPGRLVAKA